MLCQNAVRIKQKKPFICKKMAENEGVDYTNVDADKMDGFISDYMCVFQRYCPDKGETINSEHAKYCKLRQSCN